MKTILAVSIAFACTFFATEARAQTLAYPQGLTCGLSYVDATTSVGVGTVNTFYFDAEDGQCNGAETYLGMNANGRPTGDPAAGFAFFYDGDAGNHAGAGFVHQELVNGATGSAADSTHFILPLGTACGFHHTQFSPGHTCMGYQPSKWFGYQDGYGPPNSGTATGIPGCPVGWYPREAFDMSSGSEHWVWCEYQDPNHVSANPGVFGPPAIPNGVNGITGITCGISSNWGLDDSAGNGQGLNGACMGFNTKQGNGASPPRAGCRSTVTMGYQAMYAAGFHNSGESPNTGLTFCATVDFYMGPQAPVPAARQPPPPAVSLPSPDCTSTGCSGSLTCCPCTASPTCTTATACNRACGN